MLTVAQKTKLTKIKGKVDGLIATMQDSITEAMIPYTKKYMQEKVFEKAALVGANAAAWIAEVEATQTDTPTNAKEIIEKGQNVIGAVTDMTTMVKGAVEIARGLTG